MLRLDQFHYQILGNSQGPKLVFLHGLMGSAANWRKITNYFIADYHILIIDQRGHGRSFHPKSGYTPEDYANDLKFVLDSLAWARILLVGHSMGGRNALSFSFRWPERVMRLVLEDIGPDANFGAVRRIENLLGMVPTPFPSRLAAKKFLLEEFPLKIGGTANAQTLAQYFYSNIEEKDGGADWRFYQPGIMESLIAGRTRERWHELAGLKMPILILRGEGSTDLSRETFLRMKECNPLVTAKEIANSGHWIHFDQPEAFVVALKDFFTVL